MSALRLLPFFALLSAACAGVVAQPSRVTQADLIRRVYRLDRLVHPPAADAFCGLFSSFDRAAAYSPRGDLLAPQDGRDAGHFQGTTEDGWDVLARGVGPGVITRIWTDRPAGRLRITVSGKVVFQDDFAALFDGSVQPFDTPLAYRSTPDGSGVCYFPIGFEDSIEVATKDFSGRYEISAERLSGAVERVEDFNPLLDEGAWRAMKDLLIVFSDGFQAKHVGFDGRRGRQGTWEEVADGETLGWSLEGSGTIRQLFVALTDRIDPRAPYALHQCIVRITFDRAERPQVEVPFTEFFGAGSHRPASTPWASAPTAC